MDAARAGIGVVLANSTIAHDDLTAGRLLRPIPHAIEVQDGYRMLIPKSETERREVKAFRKWLHSELASSFVRSGEAPFNAPRTSVGKC